MAEAATKLPLKREEPAKAGGVPSTWTPFASLRAEVDRLFDEFAPGWPSIVGRPRAIDVLGFERFPLHPAVEATENEKAYVVTAELPGLDEKDVEISLSDGVMTIRGEKKEETEEEKEGYYLSERRYGAFERRFQLPNGIDHDRIEASLKNGVLKVELPKTAEAQKRARRIEVKAK